MAYKPYEIESMLLTKLKMDPSNEDHTWFEIQIEGLPKIRTKLSFTRKKEIGDKLIAKIHKQLRVRKIFFIGLMDCTKSLHDYEAQVKNDPYPPFNHIIV